MQATATMEVSISTEVIIMDDEEEQAGANARAAIDRFMAGYSITDA